MQRSILREIKRFLKLKKQKFNYSKWIENNEKSSNPADVAEISANAPLISILVPCCNPKLSHLQKMIESVLAQTAENWELCLADASTDQEVISYLQQISINYNKIHIQFLKENQGIAANTMSAINLSKGEYFALLDHDDLLAPNAIHELNLAIQKGADFIYTDEDKIKGETRVSPHFKPSWNPWLLRSFNYICHFTAFKRSLYYLTDGFDSALDGAQDYDIILKLTEKATNIVHIHKILYHWRIHKNSTSFNLFSKPQAHEAGKTALINHMERLGIAAKVESHVLIPFKYVCTPKIPKYNAAKQEFPPKITIFVLSSQNILSKREATEEYLTSVTFYQDFEIKFLTTSASDTNNNIVNTITQALLNTTSEYIAFCSEDILTSDKNWLSKMLSYMTEPKTGLVTGNFGSHSIYNMADNSTLNNIANSTCNVHTIHSDCILVKREILERVPFDNSTENDDLSSYISTQFSKHGFGNIWVEDIRFKTNAKNKQQSGYRG